MFILLSLILFISLLFIKKNNNKKYRIKYPNGPLNFPIIGGLWKITPEKQHLSLDKLYHQYGPVFQMKLGSIDTVFLNDPEVISEAYHINSSAFIHRMMFPTFDIVSKGIGIGFSNIEYWKKIRGILNAAMTKSKTRLLEDLFNEEYFKFDQYLKLKVNENQNINMRPILKRLTFNIIFKFLFGESFEFEDNKISKEITEFIQGSDELLKYLTKQPSDFIKFLRPFTSHKKLHQIIDLMFNFLKPKIEQRIQNIDEENPKCLIDYLYIQIKNDPLQLVKAEALPYISIELMVGGIDTTSTTLEWMILFLSNNEQIQDKLYQDIGNKVEYPKLAEKNDYPFFNATIRETLRRSPPIPMGLPHMCTKSTEIGGYVIPKGSLVISNLYSANNSEKFYANPLMFNPLRYIETNNKDQHINNGVNNISFSIGPRVCPGKNFAEDSLFSIGTKLFKNFKFSKISIHDYDESAISSVTLEPKQFNSIVKIRN